jgi:c-di-GMP-binding flagellar brake protein YcgR
MAGQISMLDRNDGTSWMNRQKEVMAHLQVAVDELEFVTVEAGRESQFAYLSLVPGQREHFLLYTGGHAVFPSAVTGSVIKVVYERDAASYEFLSVVTERMEGGKLAVSFPQFIERRERRSSRRVDVGEDERVHVCTDQGEELSVSDLSMSGVGIVASRAEARQLMKDGIRGVLQLGDSRISVWLDVRHSRKLGTDEAFVGARFLGLSAAERSALRNFIERRLEAE